MKTFKDLEFKPKPYSLGGTQGRANFPNGYGVSVIQGFGSYTKNNSEYELAVFHNGNLCYDTPITNDVLGHLTKRQVTSIMKRIQKLKRKKV